MSIQKKFVSLWPTLVSPEGHWGQTLLVIRTFTNVIFDCRISQIHQSRRDATETSALGVLYLSHLIIYIRVSILCNTARRGLTRVAYPGQGNARARQWDKREVENSHVFCVDTYANLKQLTAEFWGQEAQNSIVG